MKKLLLIIPSIFCLLLNLVAVPVHAEDEKYITLEEFMADERFKDASAREYYFYFTYDSKHPSLDVWYNRTCVISTSSDDIQVDEEDGVYTISTSKESLYLNYYEKRDGRYNGASYNSSLTCNKFVYDSNTNLLSSDSQYFTDNPWTVGNVQTNMFEVTKKGDITVTVDPELKGTVSLDSGNVSYNSIDVTIHNNTNYPYQYSIFVVQDGNTISFDNLVDGEITSDSNITLSGKSYSGTAQYVYVTNEWIQTYVNNDVAVVNSPSTWHYLYPQGQQIAHISTRCIKLLPNVDYRLLVYACRIDSEHVITYVGDPAFDVENRPFEAYNAFFRVASATPFDPNNVEPGIGGTLTFDPSADPDSFFDKVNGYEDSNGNVVVSGKKFNELHSIGGSSSGSSSSGSYSTLASKSRSFFSFLRTVLGYFPSDFITVLNLGLWSIAILAIVRRLH